ncbi:DUF3267 domain-containing protein [Clostridium sp. HBUAS56010]|uniref:DUF3267 domain-containing protein n=1 Tax=Clostridium sp. HBUAS56010 TaxID=2571127 RepID=UPI001178A41F|nr:DUF3267 domain-containing protein [Clostridium sp. HBUAS56010]
MRYTKKIPKGNEEKRNILLHEGYNRIKEPKSVFMAIVLSFPLSIIAMAINGIWCYYLNPDYFLFQNGDRFILEFTIDVKLLIGIILTFLIHEFLHAVFIPRVWTSDKTYWGLNGLFGFVYTEEPISKGRFLLISVLPLIILSFLLPLVLSLAGIWSWNIIFFSILNAGGSCVDLLNMILIGTQVPYKGIVISNGSFTFYKADK